MTTNVNPNILVWVRETAGLGAEDAAPKLQLGASTKSTATEKLVALERGEKSWFSSYHNPGLCVSRLCHR